MKAVVIRDTGKTEVVELVEFAELQKACGGTRLSEIADQEGLFRLEHIDGRIVESPTILADEFSHLTMWANEEGQIHGFEQNPTATIVLGWWGARYPDGSQAMLYGDVVVTGPTDRNGDRTALAENDADAIVKAAANVVVIRR